MKLDSLSYRGALEWPALTLEGQCENWQGFELTFRLSGRHIEARKDFLKTWLGDMRTRLVTGRWLLNGLLTHGMWPLAESFRDGGWNVCLSFRQRGAALRVLGKDSRWLGETIFCLIDGVRNLVASTREGMMSWLWMWLVCWLICGVSSFFKMIGDACGDFFDVSCYLVLIAFLRELFFSSLVRFRCSQDNSMVIETSEWTKLVKACKTFGVIVGLNMKFLTWSWGCSRGDNFNQKIASYQKGRWKTKT